MKIHNFLIDSKFVLIGFLLVIIYWLIYYFFLIRINMECLAIGGLCGMMGTFAFPMIGMEIDDGIRRGLLWKYIK